MRKIILALFLLFTTIIHAQGLRILFIGDSITDGGWGNSGGSAKPSKERNHWDMNHIYGHSYMFPCATHYQANNPEERYQFFNRGISANTLNDLEERWEEDVIAIRPDILSILIGTNDVNESLGSEVFDIQAWELRYRQLLNKTLEANPNTKFVLCTPFTAPTGRLKDTENYTIRENRIQQCIESIKNIAKDYKTCLVSFDALFQKLLKEHPINEGKYWIWDGIHPTPAGHQQMADLWIKETRHLFLPNRQSLPYILDMVHNNPGEKPYITKYNTPSFLKSQGFNGAVTHWHINCAINYDNYKKGIIKNKEEKEWIERKAKDIEQRIKEFHEEGIAVYPFTDFIVFPQSVWEKYGKQITGEGKVTGTGGSDERARKPNLQNKRTQELLIAQIDGIFNRFPTLDGLTLRFGETYLHDTPFHLGGSPIRNGEAGIKDHILLLNILREEICVKRNKKLFYRTWDFGFNFHTNPQYYLAVTNEIEPHPNLIFSIKYQQDDYHRMTPFNPTLGIGKHQQIVESQSRMEAYGKGAHPYYTAQGVIEGWPETKYEILFGEHRFTGKKNSTNAHRGIKDILSTQKLQGVMTWSNGGGWQGPYITHEIWTDLNTYVVSHWAQNPQKTEEELFYEFTDSIGLDDWNADLFREIAIRSIEGVRKGHCNSYTRNDVWWTRDEFFSAAANKKIIRDIISNQLQEKVLAEKSEASAIWQQMEALSQQMTCKDKDLQEAIQVSCTYGRIKYQLIEQMWKLMITEGLYQQNMSISYESIKETIDRYDELWKEWHLLKESSPWCATLYTDMAFRNQQKGSIGELVNQWKERIKNIN